MNSVFPQTEPRIQSDMSYQSYTFGGLTKRELFAAMILQGYWSNGTPANPHAVAIMACEQADILIDALSHPINLTPAK